MGNFNVEQTQVFRYIQFHRMTTEMGIARQELSENARSYAHSDASIFKKAFIAIDNSFKNSREPQLLENKNSVEANISSFFELIKEENIFFDPNTPLDVVRRMADSLFENDPYNLGRVLFSTTIIFDNEFDYVYPQRSLNTASYIIWGNSYMLSSMKRSIEEEYTRLAKQPMSSNQKALLFGVAAVAVATAVVPTLAFAGASASGITGGLAGFGALIGLGGTMVEGIGLVAIAELLADGLVVGATYALMDAHNKAVIKKSFREMDYNTAAQTLAIKSYLLSHAKQHMPPEIFKKTLADVLLTIQDLKADTDQALYIDKEDVEDCRKKIQVFHNLDAFFMASMA